MAESGEVPVQKPGPQVKENPQSEDHAASTFGTELGRTLAERHPDWPPVKLKLYFSPHGTAEDMLGMKDHLKDADIYLYENILGNGPTKFFQKLANEDPAKLPPDAIDKLIKRRGFNGGPIESEVRGLLGTKKIVGHMDLRPGDPIKDEKLMDNSNQVYAVPDFDETLNNLKVKLANGAKIHDQRENIMIARFEEELGDILIAHPELRQRPELKVLATMGAQHTTLFHKFKAAEIDTERAFSDSPFTYSSGNQVMRDILFGKEPSPDILAKAHLEEILYNGLRFAMTDEVRNSYKAITYIRQAASKFNTPEIKTVHEMVMNGEISVERVDELLIGKGLGPLPRSNEELERWVKEREEAERAKKAEVKAEFQQRRRMQGKQQD